ncbi:hypothetical protein FLI59_30970 [Pseudomonas aeruginosa]|nr:hypothetical protein FLI59_30970 [Pseudomonas aeruginosa]
MRATATISKANHYFRINGFYEEFAVRVILPFCKLNLCKMAKKPIPGTRKQAWFVQHVFARSNYDKSEYRLPIETLKEFVEFAGYRGYKESRLKIQDEPEIEGKDVVFEFNPGFDQFREGQGEWIDYMLSDGHLKVNNASTGFGKMQPLYAKIKVPGGWKTMGEMTIGTEVIAADGTVTQVTGVYPHGKQPIYRLHFEDGRYTDAGLDHLWKVFTEETQAWTVVDTRSVQTLLAKEPEGVFIPLCEPEDGPEKPFVPDQLEGSRQQRLEYLRRLMDEKGYVRNDGSLSFSSEDEVESTTVQYLVRSLGGIARKVPSTGLYRRRQYRVYIKYPRPEELFTLANKGGDLASKSGNQSLKLRVSRIEFIGEHEARCISVAHPDRLYITDDFIVTHNTYMAIHSMVKIGKRTLITMQPRYQINWVRELNKIVKLIPGDLLIWENTLESLYECLEDGKFDPKIIIIPMSRIEVFLRKGKETRDGLHMDDLIKRINPGLRIIDEGHEAIHQIFLSLMFGNIKKLFLLSATLKADDPFTNKMYQYLFPKRLRLKEAEPEHYIDVVAYLYRLNTRRYHLKTDQFGAYNDKTFEKSILKSGVLLAFYFKLVNKAFKEYYLNVRREGTKCLFFFSRVNMCDAMLELFRKEYPGWDFETFTGDDSKLKDKKDKYLKHEIIITTPNSCGTGKDIGGLVTVICAHTVASTQANKQIIGRLRALSGKFNNEIDPAFVFLVCLDLAKHVEYLAKREQVFFEKQKTFKRINSECSLD